MSRKSFIEDASQVGEILVKIAKEPVRLFEGPVSYHKLRKLEDAGYLEHKLLNRTGRRGHGLVGFGLTSKGSQLVKRAVNAKRKAA